MGACHGTLPCYITALHGSAKHCCMRRSAKYRKNEISTSCGTKTRQPILTKFGRGDHAVEYIRSEENVGVHWAVAPPRDGRLSNFCDFVLTLFPEPAYRSDVTLAYHVLCIKRRGFVDTRAFWGESAIEFDLWRHLAEKSALRHFRFHKQNH